MNEERCEEIVFDRYHNSQCTNRPKVERNGRWYCGIHDPVRREEKRKAQDEKWEKEVRERQEKWRREKAAASLCENVTAEELEQLGVGWLRRHLDTMKEGK